MFEMLRLMSPPVGFGTKCPSKLAYKVRTQFAIVEAENVAIISENKFFLNCLAVDSYEYAH